MVRDLKRIIVLVTAFSIGTQNVAIAQIAPMEHQNVLSLAKPRLPRALPTSMPMPRASRIEDQLRRAPVLVVRPHPIVPYIDWRKSPRDLRLSITAASRIQGIHAPNRSTAHSAYILAPSKTSTVSSSSRPLDGTPPWNEYLIDSIPGVGDYSINSATGNLTLGAIDMQLAHKGVDFNYVRAYNSMSKHDRLGSDGSAPSIYGNGWTSTYDVRVAANSAGGLSVFDESGTRLDYTPTTSAAYPGGYKPPAGTDAALSPDGVGGYYWTLKDGTVYDFFAPQACSAPAACGRLEYIFARNQKNYLSFTYSFSNTDGALSHLQAITVTAEDNETVTLKVSQLSFGSAVTQLIWPDQSTTVTYGYDASGNLNLVTEPSNNTYVQQGYGYTGSQLAYVLDPRYANNAAGTSCGAGAFWQFSYDSSNRANQIQAAGIMNFTPADGTSAPLQSTSTACVNFRVTSIGYSAAEGIAGLTTVSDTDGHQAKLSYDALGRVTQHQVYNGSQWLTTSTAWDTNNNAVSETDMRGLKTEYAFDSFGNLSAIAQPTISGSRPTFLYTYDYYNNLTASCSATQTHALYRDWNAGQAAPPANACPSTVGSASAPTNRVYKWVTTSADPYGQLTDTYNASGYDVHATYDAYGSPLTLAGASINQADATTRVPVQTFTYDSHGNVTCFNNGNGPAVELFDADNRLTTVADADDNSIAGCGKTVSSTVRTARVIKYNPDSSVSRDQTSAQYSAAPSSSSSATTYTYDADENIVSSTIPVSCSGSSCTTATTSNWYDGLGRLVEEKLPTDSHDLYSYAWMTRYLYDLGQQSSSSIIAGNTSYNAHGNLFKTQRYFGAANGTSSAPSWQDVGGSAFDSLDRLTASYFYAPSASAVSKTTRTYDASGNAGLLASVTNAIGDVAKLSTYDDQDRRLAVNFTAGSLSAVPGNEALTYDLDGHPLTIASLGYGSQSYTYDQAGRITTSTETSGGTGGAQPGTRTSPAVYSYHYYSDDSLSSLDLTSSALSASGFRRYSYRPDGLTQTVNAALVSGNFSTKYTAAGRFSSKTDPLGGSTTATYNGAGLLSTFSINAGSYTSITHDPRGFVTSVTMASAGKILNTSTVQYTTRGELLHDTYQEYADGYALQENEPVCYDWLSGKRDYESCGATTFSFDARASAPTGAKYVPDPGASTPPKNVVPPQGLGYDAEGRQTRSKFDGEDRLASQTGIFGQITSVSWNPDGHQGVSSTVCSDACTIAGGVPSTRDYHWNGDEFLFATDQNGVITDERAGPDTDSLAKSASIAVTDFDPFGNVASHHNSTGYDSWNLIDFTGDAVGSQIEGPSVNYAGGIGTDALFYGDSNQGVRQYDPQFNVWQSRDPLADFATDPVSQLAYAYAANNPTVNSDPSGEFVHYSHCGQQGAGDCPNASDGSDASDGSAIGLSSVGGGGGLYRGSSNYGDSSPTVNVPQSPLRTIAHIRAHSKSHPNVSAASLGTLYLYFFRNGQGRGYWGITNNVVRRLGEHQRVDVTRSLVRYFDLSAHSRAFGRSVETYAMETSKTLRAGGLNAIRSMATSNPLYSRGSQFASQVGGGLSQFIQNEAPVAQAVESEIGAVAGSIP